MTIRPGSKTRAQIVVVERGQGMRRRDQLATEEPLEIRLIAGGVQRSLAITMRTPGADFELAAGFLHGEGIVAGRADIEQINYCVRSDVGAEQRYNIVNVALRGDAPPDLDKLDRHFYTSSACGVCGKTSLDALAIRTSPTIAPGPQIPAEVLYTLADQLRRNQGLFEATGGLHAAGLFGTNGQLLALREDVGRHNAVDKLLGWALLQDMLPLGQHILLVSGRASFEILQKALAAGLPIVCAVSAPSNLAVSVAQTFGMTLVGFLRGERFNIYAGAERVAFVPATAAL
jgi:FdhD protein